MESILVTLPKPYCFTTDFQRLISVAFQFLISNNWNPTEITWEKTFIQPLKNLTFQTETQPFWNVGNTLFNSCCVTRVGGVPHPTTQWWVWYTPYFSSNPSGFWVHAFECVISFGGDCCNLTNTFSSSQVELSTALRALCTWTLYAICCDISACWKEARLSITYHILNINILNISWILNVEYKYLRIVIGADFATLQPMTSLEYIGLF